MEPIQSLILTKLEERIDPRLHKNYLARGLCKGIDAYAAAMKKLERFQDRLCQITKGPVRALGAAIPRILLTIKKKPPKHKKKFQTKFK